MAVVPKNAETFLQLAQFLALFVAHSSNYFIGNVDMIPYMWWS
jgi:hypothetical protein